MGGEGELDVAERVKRIVSLNIEADHWRKWYLDAMEQAGWDRAKLDAESPRWDSAATEINDSAVRAMFDSHQRMREERDRAIGALLCAAWHGCLSFDRARELLGMSTIQLRAEAARIFKEQP